MQNKTQILGLSWTNANVQFLAPVFGTSPPFQTAASEEIENVLSVALWVPLLSTFMFMSGKIRDSLELNGKMH